MAKVIVLGGGYAGLACLIGLAKKAPHLELHLVDAGTEHCKLTNLHKTFSKPASEFKVSLSNPGRAVRFFRPSTTA